jgi:phosphoglucomutase
MMDKVKFEDWLRHVNAEEARALAAMSADEIADAFGSELTFGTGGLRGKMGLGTSKMNAYTVKKATRGLAAYLKSEADGAPSVAIGFDSRHHSDSFARACAEILANQAITVYLFRELLPTPMLSYAVRRLGCSAGIMITASHNPKEYNGYKVYGSDGCQITQSAAKAIYGHIANAPLFSDDGVCFEELLCAKKIRYIDDVLLRDFIDEVSKVTLPTPDRAQCKELRIVYSPLCGTGRRPVIEALTQNGFTSLTVVKEQELPNGDFPTCPYPNPEIPEAMSLGMEYAKRYDADLLIATDPDCDRVGVAAKEADGAYRLLTGNEVGILLCDYLCKQKLESGSMPHSPVAIKTIVTSELAERVLNSYGVEVVNLLTGFKYIGEYVGKLEKRGETDRFIFGFEESCGYLNGAYVRDKDGVAASLLVSRMAAQLKATGGSLLKALAQIYEKYGYEKCLLRSYTFEGVRGAKRIADAMRVARGEDLCFDSFSVRERVDYSLGISDLPKTDAIKFILDRGSVILRPSGTEPKLKMYVCGIGTDEKSSEHTAREIADCVELALGLS